MQMLKKTIRPEFLNRIDEIIMFTPLDKEEVKQIVRLQIGGVVRMLEENGIHLAVSDAAVSFLSEAGFDPEFGARPVKRAIQQYLLNDLSKKILAGDIDREKPVQVDREGDRLVFSN